MYIYRHFILIVLHDFYPYTDVASNERQCLHYYLVHIITSSPLIYIVNIVCLFFSFIAALMLIQSNQGFGFFFFSAHVLRLLFFTRVRRQQTIGLMAGKLKEHCWSYKIFREFIPCCFGYYGHYCIDKVSAAHYGYMRVWFMHFFFTSSSSCFFFFSYILQSIVNIKWCALYIVGKSQAKQCVNTEENEKCLYFGCDYIDARASTFYVSFISCYCLLQCLVSLMKKKMFTSS